MQKPQSTILIVDDDRSNLDVLTHILRPNYNICIAKSGKNALLRVHEDKPDLILLDILMPDMDGFSVLAALKGSSETRDIPVIFITGLASVHDEEKGFLLGAVDYIVKPFNNSIVKARVRTHMRIVSQMQIIEKLGMMDALTNIPNRRHFDQQIVMEWGRAIREKTPLSLLIVDVDNFKRYNDSYGHPQGDIALQSLAQTLVKTARRPSDFIARLGGEEFAVILPMTDKAGAIAIAEEARTAIESMEITSTSNAAASSITASIGVVTACPKSKDSMQDFIEQGDKLLYEAKNSGRNQVCS